MVIVHLDGQSSGCIYPADKLNILPDPEDSEVEIMVPLLSLSLSAPQATTTATTIEMSPPVVGSVTAGGEEIPVISWTPADAARMGISKEVMSYLGHMDSAEETGIAADREQEMR